MRIKSRKPSVRSAQIFDNLVGSSFANTKRDLSLSDGKSNGLLMGLPELLRPEKAAAILSVSIKTIYDWRYRGKSRRVPAGLFVKLNRALLVRTSVLKEWIASQNPSLRSEGE